MSEDIRETSAYAIAVNRAYRFLTVVIVTKCAKTLAAIELFRKALACPTETAEVGAFETDGLVSLVASADGILWAFALVFTVMWLVRAAAGGLVSFARDAYPRRLGALAVAGLLAALALDAVFYLGSVAESFVVVRGLSDVLGSGTTGGLTSSVRLPVLYFKLCAARVILQSLLHLVLIVFLRKLINRIAEDDSLDPAGQTPVQSAAEESSAAGFGWPEHPVR